MIELAKVKAYVRESPALDRVLGGNLSELLDTVRPR